MWVLSELSLHGGTAELRQLATAQTASLAALLGSHTMQPAASAPLPTEQQKLLQKLRLSEAEVRQNYTAFSNALIFQRARSKADPPLLHKEEVAEAPIEQTQAGVELLAQCEDAPMDTWDTRFVGKQEIGHGGSATVRLLEFLSPTIV